MAPFSKMILPVVTSMICVAAPGDAKGKGATEELRAMAKADQVGRTAPGEVDPVADEARQKRVLALLAEGQVTGAEAQECAAWILQHSGLKLCNGSYQAISLDNYLLAHLLARSAAERGRKSARWLAAAALDRYLVYSGKPQKFGTQMVLDLKTEKMVIPPIDPTTTDEERAKWGVEPLIKFMKQLQ